MIVALILIALAGCNMPPEFGTALKTDAAVGDPSCDAAIDRRETRDRLKNLIVRSATFGHESHADRPDFFLKNRVMVGFAELRPDHSDLVAYVSGARYCGTGGCVGFILKDKAADLATPQYSVMTRIRPARLPIVSLKSSQNGWVDLGVAVAGGGIVTPYTGTLSFDGTAYSSNPTLHNVPQASESDVKAIIIGDRGTGSKQCRLF